MAEEKAAWAALFSERRGANRFVCIRVLPTLAKLTWASEYDRTRLAQAVSDNEPIDIRPSGKGEVYIAIGPFRELSDARAFCTLWEAEKKRKLYTKYLRAHTLFSEQVQTLLERNPELKLHV